MHSSLLEILVCPACRVALEATVHEQSGRDIELGFLRCPRCAIVVPVLDGLLLFTEPLLHEGLADAEALRDMALRLYGDAQAFAGYRRDKRQRGVIESYAAFAPFNESTRSVEPVLPYAVPSLRARDFILDAWCRTGWSGEWLAGRFPGQRVLSLWEGNSSVLGYRGFRHLLGSGQRAGNLDIVFCSLDKPLPFRDAAFGLVHAYDSLHRYSLLPFAGECLRVARDDAAVLFPHLHLSNSEPEPFFERGCQQRHGRDYRAWLQRITAGSSRRGWVLSEAALFQGPEVAELVDDADTAHYNGMVAILPAVASLPATTTNERTPKRFVPSPLFRLHLGRSSLRLAPGLFEGAVGHLLERHPVYAARLPDHPVALSETGLLTLLLATVGRREDELQAVFTAAEADMPAALTALQCDEVLLPAALSSAGHRLQRFHCNQWPQREAGVSASFWTRVESCDQSLLQLPDGDGVSGRDLAQFAASVSGLLRARGLVPGDWLSVSAAAHPLLLVAAVAAVCSGFNVRLVCIGAGEQIETFAHPDAKLLLLADAQPVPAGMVSLRLGLDGDASSLLAQLQPQTQVMASFCVDAGLIDLPLAQARARLALADLLEALDSLDAQIDEQLWLLEGRSGLADLSCCLMAWSRGQCLRVLATEAG